jgi:hypothetical protein
LAAEVRPFRTWAEPAWLGQQISQVRSTRVSCPVALRSVARGEIFQLARDVLQHLADLGTVDRDVLDRKLTGLAHEGRRGRERDV